MSSSFVKPLLLPSNGLSYSPIFKVKQIDMRYIFAMASPFFASSSTELIYTFLNKYSEAEYDISEMYWADAYYVWLLLLADAFKMPFTKLAQLCTNCSTVNEVRINLEELDVTFIKQQKQQLLSYQVKKEGHNPFTIKYERRKIVHNIQCGNYLLESENLSLKEQMIMLMKPQLKYILIGGKKISNEKIWKDLFDEFTIKEIKKMLDKLAVSDFGFQSNMLFDCAECNHSNIVDLYSPYSNSAYIEGNVIEEGKFHNIIDIAIMAQKSRVASYSEIMNMTPSELNLVISRANEVLSEGGGNKNVTPEDFMQQFGVA